MGLSGQLGEVPKVIYGISCFLGFAQTPPQALSQGFCVSTGPSTIHSPRKQAGLDSGFRQKAPRDMKAQGLE